MEERNIAAYFVQGPTLVQVFQDEKTFFNYMRVLQGDISQVSWFLIEIEIADKSFCNAIGVLNILNQTYYGNYDIEIGVICKHTLFYY